MDAIGHVEAEEATLLDRASTVLLRTLALIFMGLSLIVWSLTIGYLDENVRFDLLGKGARLYLATLCVLFPVVAVGLWTALPWGRVVWFAAIAIHMIALGAYGLTLAGGWRVLYAHLASLALYLALRAAARLVAKKR